MSILTSLARRAASSLFKTRHRGNIPWRMQRFVSVWSQFLSIHALGAAEGNFGRNFPGIENSDEMKELHFSFLKECREKSFIEDEMVLEAVTVMLLSVIDLCFSSEGRREEISRSFQKGERVLVKMMAQWRLRDEDDCTFHLLFDFSNFY